MNFGVCIGQQISVHQCALTRRKQNMQRKLEHSLRWKTPRSKFGSRQALKLICVSRVLTCIFPIALSSSRAKHVPFCPPAILGHCNLSTGSRGISLREGLSFILHPQRSCQAGCVVTSAASISSARSSCSDYYVIYRSKLVVFLYTLCVI